MSVKNKAVTGRDHCPYSFSLWMAGRCVKGGQTVGKTDEIGWGVEELTYRFKGETFA